MPSIGSDAPHAPRIVAACLCVACCSALAAEVGGTPAPAAAALSRASQPLTPDATSPAASRTALVIGNSAYETLPRLGNASNDAADLCAKLRSLQFDATCRFDVPDRIRTRELVQGFLARARQADTVLFYFAGHGVQIDGENYLLPTKVAPLASIDLQDEGLAIRPVLKSLWEVHGANAGAYATIVIVEAAWESTLERPIGNVSRGLAPMEAASPQMIVLASAAPGTTVRDSPGRNSLFARALLDQLGEPATSVDEAFRRTSDQVRREAAAVARAEQIPSVTGSLTTRLCLAGCERGVPAALAEELNRRLDEARKRIGELEDDKARNARERQESAQLIAKLEGEVRTRETSAATASARDRSKDAELTDLRAQLANARSNQRQLDEMGAAVQKAKDLQEANFRLSKEKQDALLRVAKLQEEIDARSQTIGKAGEANRKGQEEIARLRTELDDARSRQRQLQQTEARVQANDVEISSLRATIAQLRSEQAQRERQYAEQQKQRDEEYRKLQQALKESSKSEAPAGRRPAPPPMPAGF
jgi:hypothetical protein